MIDIGFIGLGTMGRPMAGHLQAAGHRLFLHDVGPIAPELVAEGGVVCKSGKEVAEKADVVIIMVPGPERAFNTMKPVFDKMGKNVTLVGANGDGQTTKVANQIIVALTIEAVGEALLFASKAGADPALVRQALMGGFASSRILEVHGERM